MSSSQLCSLVDVEQAAWGYADNGVRSRESGVYSDNSSSCNDASLGCPAVQTECVVRLASGV